MKKYLSFISYRHQPDSSDAAFRLRRGLEGYHLPKGCSLPKRRRVFRDTDELPTSSDLGVDIENALRDSEYLIALCSEEYVKSRWCLREIELFVESGRKDRILPVLISGTPETSVPAEIRDLPVAADLRADIPESRPYDRTKAKAAIPQVLALMSDMPADRIAGAEFRFRAAAAGAAAAFAAAGLLGFAGYASYTADRIAGNNERIAEAALETEKEEKRALEERNTALLRQSEYVAEQAWETLRNGDSEKAIELALSALPEDLHGDEPISPEAEGVLRVALSMELPPSYKYAGETETDFDILGFYAFPNIEDRMFLLGDRIEIAQPYVTYLGETGSLETDFAESRREAAEQGYTRLLHLWGDANARKHYYYGPGKQLFSENSYEHHYRVEYTLGGEPFCAAGAALDGEYGSLVAWEDPGETEHPRTALFGGSQSEAMAELDIEGIPAAVSFSGNMSEICVVDEAGNLHVYDNKGKELETLEGGYTDVYYFYNNGSCACTGARDGTVTILDLAAFTEKGRFQCVSPVRRVRVCKEKNCVLVCCDSGVYLYNYTTGSLITEIGSGALPNFAVWKNDRGNNSVDPDMILLIYDRRVEFYAFDTDIDSSVTDYIPLIQEGVPKGSNMVYSRDGRHIIQHSFTGDYVYNPGQDNVYCWDAYTGEFLWENENPWYCYRSGVKLSDDGKTLWRAYEGRNQTILERVDIETGETVLSARWLGSFSQPMDGEPVESPDGTRAFLTMQLSSTSSLNCTEMLLVFDTATGELLWRLDLDEDAANWRETRDEEIAKALAEGREPETGIVPSGDGLDTVGIVPVFEKQRESGTYRTRKQLEEAGMVLPGERTGFAKVMFSKDGKYLYCVQNAVRKGTGESGICVDRLDVETGEILDERFLALEDQKITLWEEEEAFVLIDSQPDEVNNTDISVYSEGGWTFPSFAGADRDITVDHTVRIFDLAKWDMTEEIPFSYLRSPEAHNQVLAAVRPFAGGMALYWETENGDGDGENFCCALKKDGTLGEILEADSEAGRRLWVPEENYLNFNGEEAFFSQSRIYRLSDGALMLQSSWPSTLQVTQTGSAVFSVETPLDRGIAAAKDGSSICMYSPYGGGSRTPFLVLPSDLDTLVEKGKKRIAMRSE